MPTVLDKELKRRVAIDGADYTVAIDPQGIRLTGKGKRRAEVELRWLDLLNGDAALAVALNASLATHDTATSPKSGQSPERTSKRASRKQPR